MEYYFDRVSCPDFTPSDCIRAMYNDTFNGVLQLRFPWDEEEDFVGEFVCRMNWDAADAEKVITEYENLYDAFAELAGCYDPEDDLSVKYTAVQANPRLSVLWDIYLRPFQSKKFHASRIAEINEKEDKNEPLTAAEQKILDLYCDEEYSDLARRISGCVCTYETVKFGKNLCALMARKAPQTHIDRAASLLAVSMALCACCTERKEIE